LTTHWKKNHPETDQVLGKEECKIYDPKEFVKSILDGTSHVEVAESAFFRATERLMVLGKGDVGANVLGRKLDIEI
jgi:acetyl-CoA carboxylase carboxyltransferase component